MGISWQQLVIILVIVALIFGTRKLRNIGSDVGGAVKGFRKAMGEGEEAEKMHLEDEKKEADAEFSESSPPESSEENRNS